MIELRPPDPFVLAPGTISVFLAGSIEMGAAIDWQCRVKNALQDLDVAVLNPRREAWDASWPQTPDFAPFREQVEWELVAQEAASLVIFYFSPDTKSPITLLELGLNARRRCLVCCPAGYWRKGNVDMVCRHHGLPQAETLDDLIEALRMELRGMLRT